VRTQLLRGLGLATAFAVMASSGAAQTRINPICGNHLTIGNITYTLGSETNQTGGCQGTTTPSDVVHLLGSPSGLATQSGTGTFPGLAISTDAGGDELWVVTSYAYDVTFASPAQQLECVDEAAPEIIQPYLELPTTGGLIRPCFGSSGPLPVYFLWAHEDADYGPTGVTIDGRSTDIDGDGDTDEADEKALIAAFGTTSGPNLRFDLNWSGSVDASDLSILLQESLRRDSNNQAYRRGHCNAAGSIIPYDGNYRPIRPAAPTSVSASGGCNLITVSWTNTGNDSLLGDASTYEVRSALSAITNETQWANATTVAAGTAGANGLPSSAQVWVGQCSAQYYFAVRLYDDQSTAGAIGSSSSWAKTLCPQGWECEDASAHPVGPPHGFDPPVFALARGTPTTLRGPVSFDFEIPSRFRGAALGVDVLDVNGRVVRHLGGTTDGGANAIVNWDLRREDGHRAAVGVYFLRGILGSAQLTQRLVVLP